jgi:hypothetical protein
MLPGLAERPVGGGVPARLHVHECQLAQDIGRQSGQVRGAGGQQRPVQDHRSLLHRIPHRVDQGAPQGAAPRPA